MRRSFIALIVALSAFSVCAPVLADQLPPAKIKHSWRKPQPRVERDCTPINGRFGYYGNPWCDTGSSRPPDIDFRERHQKNRG
ncbi:hypothetical protein [Hyphomicrobium sp.]|jgi:hypothetical protein|uniref:hypothetical protein n=1 Tax=Hyphomicrobium sp. TaxID=82 RepID=UPI00356A3BF4